MKQGRREFLRRATGAAVLPLLPCSATAATGSVRVLRMMQGKVALVGEGQPRTDVWSYEATVPGPELRFKRGERLRIEAQNLLAVDTTVHFHGIRLPNAMDGVPQLTQPPIAANGGRFLYEFDLPDAGTYWYHPHLGSPEQVGRGLYGALIVEETAPPAVDRDLVWVLADWRLDREARIVANFGDSMDASHAGRIGNTVTVNGAIREALEVRAGERIRLRLINASNARIYGLRFEGHAPQVIALDGHPLEPHQPANGRVMLGPAQRTDLILDCTGQQGSAHRVIDDFYAQRAYRLLELRYSREPAYARATLPVPRIALNRLPEPDLAAAERHRVIFGGGMMGAMPSQREHRGLYWTVNGRPVPEHDHRHPPLLTLSRGRSHVLDLVNETSWHHPIHLHGHVFRVLTRDGKANPLREWRDTVLLDPESRAEIAFVADNPGDWMFHCHVLEHQATGMMAVVKVA